MKDEINDKTRTIDDLKEKVGKYDEVIDWMEHEYEERCQEYETRIDFLKAYYKAIIAKNSPQYVIKNWVKNKLHGEYVYVMILIALFNRCLTNSLAYPLAYQLGFFKIVPLWYPVPCMYPKVYLIKNDYS